MEHNELRGDEKGDHHPDFTQDDRVQGKVEAQQAGPHIGHDEDHHVQEDHGVEVRVLKLIQHGWAKALSICPRNESMSSSLPRIWSQTKRGSTRS